MNAEIEEINKKILELNKRKRKITKKPINNQYCANILRRISIPFYKDMIFIDEKRDEYGFDPISSPEKTSLILKHKFWITIKEDLIHFNKNLKEGEMYE